MDVVSQSIRLVMGEYPHPLSNLDGRHLILASASPRRRELLGMLGIDFTIADPIDIDESYPSSLPPAEVPVFLAKLKAEAYLPTLSPDDILITADTVVICQGEVLGKPHDDADAIRMLTELSGREHQVVTGVALTTTAKQSAFSAVTDVHFARLTPGEIAYYIERYRPMDKAGAYGIQEWIGAAGISRIEGSYFNVMGLPVHRLYTALKDF